MAEIDDAIYSRLSGYSGLSALVDDRIWPGVAKQGAALPYATFHEITTTPTNAMGADIPPTEMRLQVSIFDDNAPGCRAVAAQVKAALSRYSGTEAGIVIQQIFFKDRSKQFNSATKDFQINMDFRVFYEE